MVSVPFFPPVWVLLRRVGAAVLGTTWVRFFGDGFSGMQDVGKLSSTRMWGRRELGSTLPKEEDHVAISKREVQNDFPEVSRGE